MTNSNFLNHSLFEFILSCLMVLFAVMIFTGDRIKQRLSYFSTYRWEKRKRNIYDFFYSVLAGIGIVILSALSLVVVGIIVAPAIILYLFKRISKIELYDIAEIIVIIFGFICGVFLLITCPVHKPARKSWNFLKKNLTGENILADGIVILIEEYEEIMYSQRDDSRVVADFDCIMSKYCIIKMQNLKSDKELIAVKIRKSKFELEHNFHLTVLSKCRIKCKKWWNEKEYLFGREIQFVN